MKLKDFKTQMDKMLGNRHENIPAEPRFKTPAEILFGIVGKRTTKQIQEEIEYLRKVDKRTAENPKGK
tara:strand:+ start:750 stop:953 length:204 start_codon:yes stop_codon:yes gene_type:complete